MTQFKKNEKYIELLLKHSELSRRKDFNTPEWNELQIELTKIERTMSSQDIIKHAEIFFPHIQEI